jgi:uncharacterized SAM-binding protein YcdF (DUF218 family)
VSNQSRAGWWLLGVACVFSIVVVSRNIWLERMGRYLVDMQQPERADMVVVIGGDWYGNRILKAAQLVKEGYAPTVLVSGGGNMYGLHESDYAIPFAVRHGYDEKTFLKLDYPAASTRDEARVVVEELRRRGVKKYLLVTSEFHTRRAGKLFRSAGPDLDVRVVACPDTLHWNNWWLDREGQKAFFFEWVKTVATSAGI